MLSIIRDLEYKKISDLELFGKILDLGGSKKSGYHNLIKGNHEITTVNINTDYGCDLVFDIEKKFPIGDSSFDNIFLINVLEHIYNFENVFLESNRILKKGGCIYAATPFMHQIHGSPNEFFRYSKSAIEKIAKNYGFEVIKLEELGFGFLSLGYQTFFIGFIPTILLKRLFKSFFIFIDKIILKYSSKYRRWSRNNPLGYWFIIKKI